MAKAKKAATKRGKKKTTSRARRIWGRVGIVALVTFIVVGLAGLGGIFYLYNRTELPDPHSDFTTNTSFIYYQDGKSKLSSLAVQNRVSLEYKAMPQVMKDAVVAAENRSFWTDPGFSATGIARSVWRIFAGGGEIQGGGSTITQQYIKILYLDSSQTATRKVKELLLAAKMGREMPKEQILEGYLNTIYFGRGAYGIQSAARSYFLKDAKDLTLSQAAAIAAILNNPSAFNPSGGEDNLEALFGRYTYVLDGMLEMGTITQAQHDKAAKKLPKFPSVPVNNRYGGANGFLVKMVEEELLDKGFTEEQIQGGGLRITTTVDKDMQAAAVETAQRYTAEAAKNSTSDVDAKDLHVAISSVDTATGALLAQYGGRDYVKNQRNWATTPRPAASTFKAFATVAGLRNGFSLDSRLNGNTFTPRGDSRPVRNEFHHQYGPVTLRKATADSINTAFVDMTQEIDGGASAVVKAANDAGAPKSRGWDLNNRIALGAAEVSPMNQANAYATFANGGVRNEVHIVAKVTDSEGKVLYTADPASKQTIDENVAANVTDALRSVVTEGTGTRASALGRPVAGKTGTNMNDAGAITSAWFVGYTKQISTAVMYVAGDGGVDDLQKYKRPYDQTFFGSSYPLMTWVDYMQTASKGMEVKNFDSPRGIRAEVTTSADASPSPSPSVSASPSPSASPSATPSSKPTPSATPSTPTAQPTGEPTQPDPHPSVEPEPTKTTTPTKGPSAKPTGGAGEADEAAGTHGSRANSSASARPTRG